MKQKIELFGHNDHSYVWRKKGEGLQAEEHHPKHESRGKQHHVVGVLCCRRDWCTSQNRWHHEGEKLWIYWSNIKTSVRKLKLGHKWFFQMDNDHKHTSKVVAMWLKGNKVKVIGLAITKPCPQAYRKWGGRTEKACASKEAYKPDSVTPALSGWMGQNSPNLLWEAYGCLPEMFGPS